MTRFKFFYILPIIFISLISNLFGETIENVQDIKPNSLFGKYLGEHVIYDLGDYVLMMDEKLGIKRDAFELLIEKIGIFTPIRFEEGKEHPSEGFWMHSFDLRYEGKTKTYNVCYIAQENKPPEIIQMIMGNSRSSPILQKDTIMMVEVMAHQKMKNKYSKKEFFDSFIIADSNTVQASDKIKSKNIKDAYYEEWIVRACGEEFPMVIEFVPDGQGGTYFSVFDPSNF